MQYKRVIIPKHGGPQVLRVIEEELPEPKSNEVRVKVLTTGVSFMDIALRKGEQPGHPKYPFTPGCDIVGVVDKLGTGVTGLSTGQRVVALTMIGGYAEYLCVPARDLIESPADLDPVLTEPLVLNYLTAYQMLHHCAKINRNERILIHGAGGGVGTALLQLGKLLELEMYGTASARKHNIVQDLGGIPIDYRKQYFVNRIMDLTKTGVDAVFDPLGGNHWLRSYRCLRPCGHLVMFGSGHTSIKTQGGFWQAFRERFTAPRFFAMKLFLSSRDISGYNVSTYKSFKPKLYRENMKTLLALLHTKMIHPVIAEQFPLEQAAEAHQLFESGTVSGRIVLVCSSLGAG